jgi:beta-lactamase class A
MQNRINKSRRSFLFLNAISFSWVTAASVGAALGAVAFIRPSVRPAPEIQVPQAVVDARWEQMVSDIRGLADSFDGEVGIYIKDLRTGKTFRHNADRPFQSPGHGGPHGRSRSWSPQP